jgi:hypothetical protein
MSLLELDGDCAWITAYPDMYGPPPNCKRKKRATGLVCAHVYGLGWSERTPGRDGMRCALFPFTTPVMEDFVRVRGSGFESAGLDRCAISWFVCKPGRKS